MRIFSMTPFTTEHPGGSRHILIVDKLTAGGYFFQRPPPKTIANAARLPLSMKMRGNLAGVFYLLGSQCKIGAKIGAKTDDMYQAAYENIFEECTGVEEGAEASAAG
jgi:hypothetical protein